MKKYYLIALHTWQQIFEYRLSFVIWRLRAVLQVITLLFLWTAVLPQNSTIGLYNQSTMLTYVLATSFVSSIVLSSKTTQIGDEINEGALSGYLLRPMNFFLYWFSRDLGDKAMNVLFSLFEIALIILLFHPPLFFQTQILPLFFSVILLVLALVLNFFFSLIFSFVGFWSRDVWGPRFIFSQLLTFFAGGLFPLDILPKPFFNFLRFLPFPYMQFFPIKVYLGQLTVAESIMGILVSAVWVVVMYRIMLFMWGKGLQAYTASGG
jgi:ABC-2 type transport system permease protein